MYVGLIYVFYRLVRSAWELGRWREASARARTATRGCSSCGSVAERHQVRSLFTDCYRIHNVCTAFLIGTSAARNVWAILQCVALAADELSLPAKTKAELILVRELPDLNVSFDLSFLPVTSVSVSGGRWIWRQASRGSMRCSAWTPDTALCLTGCVKHQSLHVLRHHYLHHHLPLLLLSLPLQAQVEEWESCLRLP